jgi:hypothetical protein
MKRYFNGHEPYFSTSKRSVADRREASHGVWSLLIFLTLMPSPYLVSALGE